MDCGEQSDPMSDILLDCDGSSGRHECSSHLSVSAFLSGWLKVSNGHC